MKRVFLSFCLILSGSFFPQIISNPPAAAGVAVAGTSNLTAQNNNIGATTIFTPAANGFYLVQIYVVETTAAGTSSTLPSSAILWTDADSSASGNVQMTITNTANIAGIIAPNQAIAGNAFQLGINAKSGTAVQFSTSSYASNPANAMQYAIHVRVEGPL